MRHTIGVTTAVTAVLPMTSSL